VLLDLEEGNSGEEEILKVLEIGLVRLLPNLLGLKPNKLGNLINRLPWPCGEDDRKEYKGLPLPIGLRERERK